MTSLAIQEPACNAEPIDVTFWTSPAAQEIENAVISAVLHGQPMFDHVSKYVGIETFSFFVNRIIFQAAMEVDADGGVISPASVYERLIHKRQTRDIDGERPTAYLHDRYWEWQVGNGVPFAQRLRDIAIKRDLSMRLQSAAQKCVQSNEPADDIVAETEEMVFGLADELDTAKNREVQPLAEAQYRLIERIDSKNPTAEIRYPSGYETLDNMIGGFRPGRLCIVAARPAVGKSAFALAVALNMADDGNNVLIFSLEMDADEIMQRAMAIRSGVPLTKLIEANRLNHEDYERISEVPRIGGVFVSDPASLTMPQLASITRSAIRRNGVKAVVIDYLQLLTPDNSRESRYLQVGSHTRQLKQLSRRCQVPVICLCQLNRETSDDAEPSLNHLRDSGEIEQNADMVILLWKGHESDGPTAIINGKVAKQRNGTTGKFELTYRRPCVRFENKEINW